MACNRRTPRGCANCRFNAGFAYDNGIHTWTTEKNGTCILQFLVADLQDGCTSVAYEDANITVELFLNGTPITDPLIPISPTLIRGGGAYWEKWKPVANDIYTATVTYVCTTGTVVRQYSITIPDPANVDCNCCTESIPDYVVISGLTGIASTMNGTWALEKVSTCTWESGPHIGEDNPADPCFGGTQLESCTVGLSTFYYYPDKTRNPAVRVVLPGTTGKIQITFSSSYNVWRYNPTTIPTCGNTGFGSCAKYSVVWIYEIDCITGEATLLSRTEPSGGSETFNYVSGIPNPTVTLTML